MMQMVMEFTSFITIRDFLLYLEIWKIDYGSCSDSYLSLEKAAVRSLSWRSAAFTVT